MNVLQRAVLLADVDVWSAMRSEFSGNRARLNTADTASLLVLFLAALLAVWLVARFVNRENRPRPYNNPARLFQALCRAHRLSRRQRRLLADLARESGLKTPAALFLEPDRFQPANLPASFRQQADEIERLRERLFAEWPDDDSEPPDMTFRGDDSLEPCARTRDSLLEPALPASAAP